MPKAKLDVYLELARRRVPCHVWKENTKYACALLTAHMLATSGRQGGGSTGGAISQQQVGDLSRSYATMFDTERGDALLLSTRYGIDFVQLRKETIVTGMSTRNNIRLPIYCDPHCESCCEHHDHDGGPHCHE